MITINIIEVLSKVFALYSTMSIKFKSPDNILPVKITEPDKAALNLLYDKYAGIMYGNILHITKDKVLAEEIFIKAFISIKDNEHFISAQHSLSLFACMFAKRFTRQYIKELATAIKQA